MSTQTKYFCDKCKKEFDNKENMIGLSISLANTPKGFKWLRAVKLDLCVPCAKKVGFEWVKEGCPSEPQPESVQDRLYDIIAEIVQDAVQP